MARGLIDWKLAERAAAPLAGGDTRPADGYSQAEVEAACERAIGDAGRYARLPVPERRPSAELIGRGEWASNALATLARAIAPLDERLAAEITLPGPLGGIARRVVGAGAAAEAGIACGYAARKVLGQYDFSPFDRRRRRRLLFVDANLAGVRRELGADRDLFLRWIALHETTHVLQFESVSWLAAHLRELADAVLEQGGAGIDPGRIKALLRRFARRPREVARELLRGELARSLADPASRERLDRIQALMAVVEGHAEHVMDACAEHEPGLAELRAAVDERRARRGGMADVVGRLLGMEMKLRQYELGKSFWDTIVEARGEDALELVWTSICRPARPRRARASEALAGAGPRARRRPRLSVSNATFCNSPPRRG